MPILLKMIASSLISAMLRSRWVFSITLAASATLMLGALWVPATMICFVELVDQFGDFWRGAGGDLFDRRDAVQLVARVDAFGAVAGVKIDVELQAGPGFQHRHAVFFGRARDRPSIHKRRCRPLQNLADGCRRLEQWREVGALMLVDRCRHGDDVDVARREIGEIGRVM